MKSVKTYTATIYVGLQEGYEGLTHTYNEARNLLQEYCNENKLCVSFKKIDFIYPNGKENGIEIGLINYPRFPFKNHNQELHEISIKIAKMLMKNFKQKRCSIVFDDETIMLEKEDL